MGATAKGGPGSWASLTALVAGGVVLVAVGLFASGVLGPLAGDCALRLQFAGDIATFRHVAASTDCTTGQLPLVGPVTSASRLWLDMVAALFYGGGLALICGFGSKLFRGSGAEVCLLAAKAAGVAVAADLVENGLSLLALADLRTVRWLPRGTDATAEAIAAVALLKWAALALPVIATLAVVVTLVVRLGFCRLDRYADRYAQPPGDGAGWFAKKRAGLSARFRKYRRVDQGLQVDVLPAGPGPGSTWARNYFVPGSGPTPTTSPRRGLCLSGGGIRSATFASGATQVLEEAGQFTTFRYLAAVSGGAYHAGSHQMLRARGLVDPVTGECELASIGDAYGAGTPESDHRRRHSQYLAERAAGWLRATGVVVRNTVISLLLLGALLLIAARLQALLYRVLAPWSEPLLFPAGRLATDVPSFGVTEWGAVAVPMVLATALWFYSGFATGRPDVAQEITAQDSVGRIEFAGKLSVALVALAGLIATLVVVGPLLIVLPTWLMERNGISESTGGVAGVGLVVTVVTTGIGMVTGGGRSQPDEASRVRRIFSSAGFFTRQLLSLAVVAGIVLGATVAFAWMLRAAVDHHLAVRAGPDESWLDPWLLWTVVTLLLIYSVFDQTRMSLHPFYKRRLAATFSLERTDDGRAREIDYAIPTLISEFAQRTVGPTVGGYRALAPELLLCAAANVSDAALTPPGRKVTPFVFSHAAVGGPRLGYFRTTELELAVRGRSYEHDLTQLGAMAISGAAFASAMGRLSSPFNVLFAITNTRLGAWLPNPAFHAAQGAPLAPFDRHRRFLPRIRRLPYWLREIVGSYRLGDRFVYVTDGGHYENLGLLELLRRGCTDIVCFDASADPDLGDVTVAIRLAEEELGIRIELPDLSALRPCSSIELAPDNGFAAALAARGRLAAQAVTTGTIHYPDAGPAAGQTGRLVLGRAVLTPNVPTALLGYALDNARFPTDSTADQWFDVHRSEAYRLLGRWVAAQVVAQPSPSGSVAPRSA